MRGGLRDGGNIPDMKAAGGVSRMMPLVPHKLYRRQLLLDHDITFPEGRRFLWEDWYINVPTYRYGKVAGLEDTALYLWHASSTNTSHTFDPSGEDFWDRLDDLFEHISTTLAGPEFEQDRTALIAHNLRIRVVQRFARQLSARTRQDKAIAHRDRTAEARSLGRAKQLLRRYGTAEILEDFPPPQRALARLIRLGRIEQVRSLQLAFETIKAQVHLTDLAWREGKLELTLKTSWEITDPEQVSIVADGRGLRLDFSRMLNVMVPRRLRAIAEPIEVSTNVAVRDRINYLSWLARGEVLGQPVTTDTGLTYRSRVVIDPATAACGAPLADSVWDLRVSSGWWGLESRTGIASNISPAPMISGARQGTAYANTKGMLSLDLSGTLRVPAIDAAPQQGPIGPVSDFRARLTKVALHEPQPLSVELAAIPLETDVFDLPADERQERLRGLAADGRLSTRIVVEDGSAWLTGSGDLTAGYYLLWADRGNKWERTRYAMSVAEDGTAHLDVR